MTSGETVWAVPTAPDAQAVARARQDLASIRQAPWFDESRWSISRHNFVEDTEPPSTTSQRVNLVDITGRVIEQMPGIGLSVAEKVALSRELSEVGVREIQAGMHIEMPEMQAHVRGIRDADIPVDIIALTPTEDHIRKGRKCGVTIAEITGPSRPSIYSTYYGAGEASSKTLIERMKRLVGVAHEEGMPARVDINSVADADIEFIAEFAAAASEAGADSMSLADSHAGLGPRAVAHLVRIVKQEAPNLTLGLHLHNDFGLAASNGIAAIEAGATNLDVTVNGLGEKAGQLDLASFAVAIEAFYQVETGIRLDGLTRLSRLAEDISGIAVPPNFPITGEHAYGSAVESVQKEEDTVDHFRFMAIHPPAVGGQITWPLGRHTRAYGLLKKASSLGYKIADDSMAAVLDELDQWFVLHKRPITDGEVKRIIESHIHERLA